MANEPSFKTKVNCTVDKTDTIEVEVVDAAMREGVEGATVMLVVTTNSGTDVNLICLTNFDARAFAFAIITATNQGVRK